MRSTKVRHPFQPGQQPGRSLQQEGGIFLLTPGEPGCQKHHHHTFRGLIERAAPRCLDPLRSRESGGIRDLLFSTTGWIELEVAQEHKRALASATPIGSPWDRVRSTFLFETTAPRRHGAICRPVSPVRYHLRTETCRRGTRRRVRPSATSSQLSRIYGAYVGTAT